MLCCSCGMCFSAAASSEKDQGSMNFASNTAPVALTMPSRVAAIQRMTGCWTQRCTSVTSWPVLRSNQRRLSSSVARPSWTIRLPERSSGSASPRFSRQSRSRAASSRPHDDPGVRAADEGAAIATPLRNLCNTRCFNCLLMEKSVALRYRHESSLLWNDPKGIISR